MLSEMIQICADISPSSARVAALAIAVTQVTRTQPREKGKNKVTYFSCASKGHFAQDCSAAPVRAAHALSVLLTRLSSICKVGVGAIGKMRVNSKLM